MGSQTARWLVEFNDGVAHWLVVQTKPRQERIAAIHLWQRGVDSYLPLLFEPRRHRRAPRGPVPLFASYLFVLCKPCDQLSAVRFCPGVLRPVVFSQLLATVGRDVIEALRHREDERGLILPDEIRSSIPDGQKVRIMAGPLQGLEGVFKGYLRGRQRAQLLMQFLRTRNLVEVDAQVVTVVRA